FWWVRREGYHPAYCLVDGVQVDYAEAAKAALRIEGPGASAPGGAPAAAPLSVRLARCAALGFGAGVLGGIAIGAAEAGVIAASGLGPEAQVLWYGPLAYALVLGAL